MGKKALTFLAEGFEEVEAVTPIDYLRRAGVEVTVAAIGAEKIVRGARGISLAADTTLAALEQGGLLNAASWDGVFVPGGMPGATNLAACSAVGNFYKEMAAAGKIAAAICASPAVFLAPLGLLEGKKFTCYPGMEKTVKGGSWTDKRVVIDGNIITSRGAGTAGEFATAIIGQLLGETEAERIAQAVLL